MAALVPLSVLGAGACCKSESSSVSSSSSSSASPAASDAPTVPSRPSRCQRVVGSPPISVGEVESRPDEVLPFAVEIGQALGYSGGFVAGGLLPAEHGQPIAAAVLVDPEGRAATTVRMGTAFGDTQPPRFALRGDQLVAGLVTSAGDSRRLKLGKIANKSVSWGASFEQGRDESLAFDLALGEHHGVVVWDDDAQHPDRGVVRLALFSPDTLAAESTATTVTLPQTDADTPRLLARPGGFWLFWIAHRPDNTPPSDQQIVEELGFRWVEAVPLDERGIALGLPRRVTSASGHVVAYDVALLADGSVLLVFRDSDAPSGSPGGSVSRVTVRLDGVTEPTLLSDENLGAGAPAILDHWLVVDDLIAETRLAPLDPSGALVGTLASEPAFGTGEPIAARADSILLLVPRGTGIRLSLLRCGSEPTPALSSSQSLPSAPPLPALSARIP